MNRGALTQMHLFCKPQIECLKHELEFGKVFRVTTIPSTCLLSDRFNVDMTGYRKFWIMKDLRRSTNQMNLSLKRQYSDGSNVSGKLKKNFARALQCCHFNTQRSNSVEFGGTKIFYKNSVGKEDLENERTLQIRKSKLIDIKNNTATM